MDGIRSSISIGSSRAQTSIEQPMPKAKAYSFAVEVKRQSNSQINHAFLKATAPQDSTPKLLIGKKAIDVANTGAQRVGNVKTTPIDKTGSLRKVKGLAAKLLSKASSAPAAVKTKAAEKGRMLMASKKEQAMHKISSNSAKDKSNLSTSFAPTGVNKSVENIMKMRAGDIIVEVKTETAGKATFDRVYVKSDPKSVLLYDLAEKPKDAKDIPGYGKISLQMHKDINQRPPIFKGIDLQASGVKEDDRVKMLLDDMFSKAKASLNGVKGGPSDEQIRAAAVIALNGTTQAFEAPGQERVLNQAKQVLVEQNLIGPDTSILAGQLQKKREFEVYVKDGAIHVKGKSWVGVDVMFDGPDGLPQKSTMGVVLVERHYSIPLNGQEARRYPDSYSFQSKIPTDPPKPNALL